MEDLTGVPTEELLMRFKTFSSTGLAAVKHALDEINAELERRVLVERQQPHNHIEIIQDGLHATHCCMRHGCKYGDPECPVVDGRVKGIVCEECAGDAVTLQEIRENHTIISKQGDEYTLWLKVGVQSFELGVRSTLEEQEWMRDRLADALLKLVRMY